MRIDQVGRPAQPSGARIRRRQDGFVVNEDSTPLEPAQTAALNAAIDIVAVAGAAQAASPDPARLDREAAEHGDAMLNTLTKLQLGALGMEVGEARNCLAALAGSLKQAVDPGLNAVLQGIAARAAVEVARSG